MDSVERRCANLVHLRGNTSVHEICLIKAFCSVSHFLTLIWFSIDIYQEMTTLPVFDSFKRVSLSFDRINGSQENFN